MERFLGRCTRSKTYVQRVRKIGGRLPRVSRIECAISRRGPIRRTPAVRENKQRDYPQHANDTRLDLGG
jgi:hypothetical protein